MTTQVSFLIPDDLVETLDRLIAEGRFESRTALFVTALRRTLREIHEEEIAEEYRCAYGEYPLGEDEQGWLDAAAEASIGVLDEDSP